MFTVHQDYGHGGKDPGALGNGLQEKDLTLSIGLKTAKILRDYGINIIESRNTDKYLTLTERATIANNANADIFVSYHINSAENVTARGFEIWTSKGQTKADKLAEEIALQFLEDFPDVPFRVDKSDGDLDKEESFTVLVKTKMPSVLIELGFIKNIKDTTILRNEQDKIAETIAKGILKYLGIPYSNDKIKININGKMYYMEGVFKDSKNYVGVRELAESLGYKVDWDNKDRVVKING